MAIQSKAAAKAKGAATPLQGERFLASVREEAGERPHPASVALSKQSRGETRTNRRLAEYLRIDRGREV